MTYFCPGCWKIIPAETKLCPYCNCDLAAAGERSYPERLIGALRHPVPETRQLAAEILGQLRYRPAIEALLARARDELQERCPDVRFLAALLIAAQEAGAPIAAWQPLVDQADNSVLRKLLGGEK